MSELLDVRAAAAYLNVTPATIRKWVFTRKLGATRLGRSVRIPKRDCDKLIESGYTPPLTAGNGRKLGASDGD